MYASRDNWYDIGILDSILHSFDNKYSQIESALRNMLIQWINQGIMMQWISIDDEENKSVSIKALKVMKKKIFLMKT